MNNNKGEKFTTSPYRLWALLSAVIALASLIGIAYDRANGLTWQTALMDRALAAGIATLIAYWASLAVSLLSPIRINASGIRSYTATGTYRLITWAEMQSIDSVTLPFLRYARITSSNGTSIWIPAWLVDKTNFLVTAKQHGLVGVALERAFDGTVKHSDLVDRPATHSLQETAC